MDYIIFPSFTYIMQRYSAYLKVGISLLYFEIHYKKIAPAFAKAIFTYPFEQNFRFISSRFR